MKESNLNKKLKNIFQFEYETNDTHNIIKILFIKIAIKKINITKYTLFVKMVLKKR